MKTLEEYINDNILYEEIYEYLDNINSSFYTFTGNISFRFEHFETHKINHVYEGCNELAEFILDKMKEHNPKNKEETYALQITKEDLKNIPNIFFKELFVTVNIKSGYEDCPTASYEIWQDDIKEYKAFKYDEKEKLFNFVNLTINLGEWYSISSDTLVHELTHAYEDYKLYSNTSDDTLYSKLLDTKYIDSINNLSKRIDPYERFLRNIEYILNPHKQNAFIAQLTTIVDKQCRSIIGNNAKELYDYIYKHDKLFMSFNQLYHNFKYFVNHQQEFEILCAKYNKINNTNYSKEKLYAKLSKQIYRFRNKLVKSILVTWAKFKYNGMIF